MIERIVEQHAMNAAFLWQLRDAATVAPHYKLPHLRRLDARVDAHLDGLCIAGDGGWEICKAALADGEAGEMFAATFMALQRGDLDGVALVLDASEGTAARSRGIVSALGWISFEQTSEILPGLLNPACPAALHWLGIAACAVHRRDPGPALDRALTSDDARLTQRALQAIGELGRADLARALIPHFDAADPEIRFAAAWSAALLGTTGAAQVLYGLAKAGGPRADRALAMALRRVDPRTAATWVTALASREESLRTAIVGSGILGEPARVPWLLDCMDRPELARIAAEAFTMITGIDIEDEKLEGERPEGFESGPSDDPDDDDVAPDLDDNLKWPDLAAVRARWEATKEALPAQGRLFLGKPVSSAWLEQVLRTGGQRRRAEAAIALVLPGKPLFEVRAPGARQMALLG